MGWNYSNDLEKKERWLQTVDWADNAGLSHLIPELTEENSYFVEEISTYTIGPMGGPMYLEWDHSAKSKPEKTEALRLLPSLHDQWDSLAGERLAAVTRPQYLSGRKLRRLVVEVKLGSSSPWGSWYSLPDDERRREFTRFRARINESVKPHHIDHIDFFEN